ncbi:MAG TPA: hypothetical protein VMW24_06745 [Sedimentisphaerales bacterium]|nr:hypothetical protein [Sedimentisphaerales bacterium]
MHFPKGEPVLNVEYSPPYTNTGFANVCYERGIPVEYRDPRGKLLICHQLTWKNYNATQGEGEAEYFFDGCFVGKGDEALARIKEKTFNERSFLQVLVPWRGSPCGQERDLPVVCIRLQDYLAAKGIRLEYNEDEVHYGDGEIGK